MKIISNKYKVNILRLLYNFVIPHFLLYESFENGCNFCHVNINIYINF